MDSKVLEFIQSTSNNHLIALYQKHQNLKEKIRSLKHKPYLTSADQLSEAEIKKRKLKLKETIYQIYQNNLN